ncbi:MAG: quinolinate synthase NadA [Bacteroidota bacterium]|nr:quinolinate synthase NadA [Bacteroidota bacterium]
MNTELFLSENGTLTIQDYYTEIARLKKEKNVVILSHYYMPPQLQLLVDEGGIADFLGDSLGLSIEATKVKQENIIFCGVSFMAETAKILNPTKNVFIPNKNAGCSLASSITANDLKNFKKRFPNIPIIGYVNTYAETKAECDICCTSRNALNIVRSFTEETLMFVPDKYMGANLRTRIHRETGKNMMLWDGKCEVHEQFKSDSFNIIKSQYPNAKMLLHWEVPEATVKENLEEMGGVLGSTSDIINYVKNSKDHTFILGSECDLGSTLKRLYADKQFITPCIKCQYMKMITLDATLNVLNAIGNEEQKNYEIKLDDEIIYKAAIPLKRMLEFS